MASKEKITKKKIKIASPAVRRKSTSGKEKEKINVEIPKEPSEEDPQGSQVSVRSAAEENIQDNTRQDASGTPSTIIPSPVQSHASPQHSVGDHRKMKKDHVDEKLTKTNGPQDNRQGANMASMGSAVSLRSNLSRASREAWVENNEENGRDSRSAKTNTKSRTRDDSNIVSLQEQPLAPRENGLKGIKVDVEEDCPEKHAYIPYLYARNCIAKIMEDMAAMKKNHVVIVEKIQHHYGTIETETQEQFNMFVLCLKEDYANKRKSFRHVIDVHREEIEKKEAYWNEMLTSLAERNNRLLEEKKMLLMSNKTEIERMEKEKEDYTKQMNDKMDKMVVAPVPVPVSWEEEKKVLMDQLENEKATVASLQQQLGESGSTIVMNPTADKTEVPVVESVALAAAGAGTGAVVGGGAVAAVTNQNGKLQKEMIEERKKMNEEREQFNEERERFDDERKKWMDEISKLQLDIAKKDVVLNTVYENAKVDTDEPEKTGNEWKVKHDVMKHRLEEAAVQQAKYHALENQYAALALVVNKADTTAVVKDELKKTEEEKKMMQEEKAKIDKDIQQWEKDFVKKTGRKPTEEDKSDSVKEMYTTHQEVKVMITSLEQKEATYKQIEQGTVPDPPVVSSVPIDTREPEVITTEVKVPDPVIIKELETIQIELTTTKTEVTNLQHDISNLQNEIMKKDSEIAKQKDSISDLEKRLIEGGVAPMPLMTGGGGASDEELEALKQENRDLRKDMKKMIKQYERLSQRQAAAEGGDTSEQITEMNETITQLDSKVADLETENESLREERTILRERVKTITETITITHTKENTEKLEEKNKEIEQLKQELEKLKSENQDMQKDMKKMFKSFAKSKMRVDELKDAEKAVRLLEVVAMLIHEIHNEVPDAGDRVRSRLDSVETETSELKQSLDEKQGACQAWVEKFQSEHGYPPEKGHSDKDAEKLHADWEIAKREYKQKHLHLSALQLIKTGDTSKVMEKEKSTLSKSEIEVSNLEKALQAADGKVIDLESENENLVKEKDKYKEKAEELEKMVEDLKKQVEADAALLAGVESSANLTEELGDLQKKCDSFESELMQEKVSHVNTRDELEQLRKQLEVLKEETENERQGLEARVQAATAALTGQLDLKNEELQSMKTRNEELEAERLSKLPPETAKEIKELQDKLKQEKEGTSGNKAASAALMAQLADLTAQLEVSSKNLESQRSSNRELESKLKAMRMDKEKESKRVSRHMEEKQQKATSEDKQRIAVLVKRVKELEAQVAKGVGGAVVPVAVGGATAGKGGDAQVHMLRRELKDKEAQIKQLEKEVKLGGGVAAGATAADRMGKNKQEKILKELERKMESEKSKSEKLLEGLKAADEENQALKKELEEKSKSLTKTSAELKTLSLAAKEGVEAAGKVKDLEKDNKKLTEENVVLTKNFESERVLRKKYYNMVEDMKGKIRVYCRARPLSKTELSRGNKSVCRSADEYSIAVDTTRGLKEFQYDQIFMEDSTQERIFEDTNNLIQSAVDGYNVCIFAYGQTGSGKTFTMIGDRDQKFPGIAPRAFERIFELVDELKSKFTITVECYMMELYNDKLIDLFAKPGASADDKLDIKKDKKGLVYVQGSVIKSARNAKELFALFEEGSTNRHVASTKMNAESSRSHLVIGIIMESTNKNTGNVTKGKLSLVDLAGSERVAKTGAGAEQLKEAMSINKSLSALGDVISALSSEQQFIPYRNNKLTMLMQDSLGGNAKTLMFVNISPADYNMDETVISLTYASRVKLITNDASKNADNKEIARLKNVIAKLKKGEQIDEDDV